MTATTLDSAFQRVGELVARFKANEARYLSADYQEAEVRKDFIDKFFIALGWDVNHDHQTNPYEQEVKVEPPVSAAGQRRADYSFHLAPNFRDVRFFVEAKKAHGDIATNHNYFQIIRYGWNSDTPLAVLTNFEQFHILDCRYKPDLDAALNRYVSKYYYTDYTKPEKFAEIYWLFSHEAVAGRSLEKRAEELPKPRGKAVQRGLFAGGYQSIDESFLKELDEYRTTLARAFKSKNPEFDSATLTELAQRTLDRLVFLRFLEDKGIEAQRFVDGFGDKGTAWEDFIAASRRLDGIYNGIVFKQHGILDAQNFRVDDNAFANICESLAHVNTPYDFNAIPIHVLGSIYERFLGKVIVATDKRVRVEDKPEVRKAGGVYYTPEYIVRYIVENTVGKLIASKTPAQIAEMRFADIACGSGSFLLGVYDLLLQYHGHYYNDNPGKARKGDCIERDGKFYLSLRKKREILLNNIYGVDIDAQAVEVCQLSLYLKLLQEETEASAHQYLLDFAKQALLPPLGKNIVCGNSLIGTDILDGQLFASDEERKLNPMNFEDAFPEVMKRGGFDVIVGNPPYNAELSEGSVSWLRRHFSSVASGRADTSAMFVQQAHRLGAKRFGLLLPYRLLSRKRNHGAFQEWLVTNTNIEEILYLGCVREIGANDEFMICVFRPEVDRNNTVTIALDVTREQIESRNLEFKHLSQSSWGAPDFTINIRAFLFSQPLLDKIRACSLPLGEIAECKDGIVPHIREKLISERRVDQRYKPFVGVAGAYNLQRYHLEYQKRFICYDMNEARKWIRDKVELRKVQLRDESIFLQPRKILTAQDSATIKGTIDESKLYHSNSLHSTYLKPNVDGYKLEYILGLMNSKIVNYYHSSLVLKGTDLHPQVLVTNLPKMQIRRIDFSNPADKSRHDQMMRLVEQILGAKKQLAKAQTDKDKTYYESKCVSLDGQIDRLVYDLYGLTAEEIAIVEKTNT